jgi:hypothetical protein
MTTWTEGLTRADRQADWEKMTPEWERRVRTDMLAVVERLEHIERHALLGDSAAAQCAQEILAWLTVGDFTDARARLVALLDLARAEQLLTLRVGRPASGAGRTTTTSSRLAASSPHNGGVVGSAPEATAGGGVSA